MVSASSGHKRQPPARAANDSAKQKKKSPLYNKPQNYYAPRSVHAMTRDELSEWRKEQRRQRNRDSAAASRNKTKTKIAQLEGELDKYRRMCEEMRGRMAGMERHLQLLEKQSRMRTMPHVSSSRPNATAHALAPPAVSAPRPPIVPAPALSNAEIAPPPAPVLSDQMERYVPLIEERQDDDVGRCVAAAENETDVAAGPNSTADGIEDGYLLDLLVSELGDFDPDTPI